MDTSSLYTEFNGALQQEVEYIQQSGGEVEWWMGEGDSAEKFAIGLNTGGYS